MIDVSGKFLFKGDQVAMVIPYHSALVLGTVVKITPKGATVEYEYGDYTDLKVSRLSRQLCLVHPLEPLNHASGQGGDFDPETGEWVPHDCYIDQETKEVMYAESEPSESTGWTNYGL